MTPLETNIVATIARARRDGLEPKSVYLSPEDFLELGEPEKIAGLAVRRLSGRSRIYCRGGIPRHVCDDRAAGGWKTQRRRSPARPPP